MILIRPFLIVRIVKVKDWRIGHFAIETELTRLKSLEWSLNHRRKDLTLYYFGSLNSANNYLKTMYMRELPSLTGHWGWLLFRISVHLRGLNLNIESTLRDTEGLLQKYPPVLRFSESEMRQGKDYLQSVGCDLTSRLVCLNVRDSSYLSSSSKDYSYHNYRDSEIGTYVAGAEVLADMGYTVFRMGAIVEKPLISDHPRIIDYAFNGMRSEFLDIFLAAHCSFCVSTGSGFDSIPQLFRRPRIYVNFLPIYEDIIVNRLIIFPKQIRDMETNSVLTFNQIIERGLRQAEEPLYTDAGVEIVDLTPGEIVSAITEMAMRVEGRFVPTLDEIARDQKVKEIFRTRPGLQGPLMRGDIRGEFAACFLSRYSNWID